MFRIFATLAAIAALTLTAKADNCRHVVQTQAVVVATPAIAVATIVTPFIGTTFIGIPTYAVTNTTGYSSHADAPAAPSACDKLAAALEKQNDTFNKLLTALAERQPPQVAPQPVPAGPPLAPPPFALPKTSQAPTYEEMQELVKRKDPRVTVVPIDKAPGLPAPNAAPTPEQLAKLKADPVGAGLAVCNVQCAKCHDAKAPQGGFTLIDKGQFVNLSWEQRNECVKRVHNGSMPKNGDLSDYEEAAIISAITSLPPPQIAAK